MAVFGIQENLVLILIEADSDLDSETNREALWQTMMRGKRMVVCGVVDRAQSKLARVKSRQNELHPFNKLT